MQNFLLFVSCLACASYGKRVLTPSNPASAFQAPAAAGTSPQSRGAASNMAAPYYLKELAVKLNPAVGFYDPLNLGAGEFLENTEFLPRVPENNVTTGNDATVGWLRHAEIKHGRVAMAAFVGYILQSNGIVWPWKLTDTVAFADIAKAGSPPEQWDALPTAAKVQILLFIGFLESWSETTFALEGDGYKHYMRGGVPGKFPSFDKVVHPVPFNLYDPFGLNKKKSREALDRSLLAEINNGRLAQLGIMAFLAEQKVPGSVPVLAGLGVMKPYSGEVMAPFTASDASLPFVTDMLKLNLGPLL